MYTNPRASFSKREQRRRRPFQSPEQAFDFGAPLVPLPGVFLKDAPGLERRHHQLEPPLPRPLTGLVAYIRPAHQLRAASVAGLPGARADYGPRARHAPGQATASTSPPVRVSAAPRWILVVHPRRTRRWPGDRFFERSPPVGMHLHAEAVYGNRLQLEPYELFFPEVFHSPVEESVLRPAIEPRRSSPPLAALLGDLQVGAEHVHVRDM